MTVIQRLAPLALFAFLVAACGGGTTTTTGSTSQPQVDSEPTMVRFVHAVPDGPAIDALVGDWVVAEGVGYEQWGDWAEIPSGEWDVALRQGEAIVYSDIYDFRPNERYWVFAFGTLNATGNEMPVSFLIAPEERFESGDEETWIRFANLTADGEGYGLAITTGDSWGMPFPNQPIGTISVFKLGPILENTFEVIPARDTSLPAVVEFDRNMQVGILYTIIVTGRANNGTLEVFHIAESAVR